MPAPPLTFTLDLEDHRPDERAELRFPSLTARLLDDLDDLGVRATVFVVGELAERVPALVAEIAQRGHEVGLHGWRHEPLPTRTPGQLRHEVHRGRALLEDVTGAAVVGFRAPTFSLVPDSAWATDVLADEGFTYSSSVLPARNPLFGWPGAPTGPFRWPSGLVEVPCPVAGVGPAAVPTLGGVYLRVLPWGVVRRTRNRPSTPLPWIYAHPYDFDPDEPFWVVPDAGPAGSRLLWRHREAMWPRVAALLRTGAAGSLGDRVAALDRGTLPVFPAPAAASGTQLDMVHRLPPAAVVDRIDFLTELAAGRRVIHVGFVDAGYRAMQDRAGAWLHGHLDEVATTLVGLDLDVEGVAAARAEGYEAHVVDCRRPDQVGSLGLEPADVVIAGEVIEHVDDPGAFLDGLQTLVAPDGLLVITTPNATGLLNAGAALVGREVNHPDHVLAFTWRTLAALLRRHRWEPLRTRTYIPRLKEGTAGASGVLSRAASALLAAERLAGRLGAPFLADGLIVVARRTRS